MTAVQERGVVVATYQERRAAERAVQQLREVGFAANEIGIASRGDPMAEALPQAQMDKVSAAAAAGAIAGGAGGVIWGVGIAAGLLPGIGPAIAGGTLAAILSSAATGAATAGIAGALIGLGIPEDDANRVQAEFQDGRTIVTVSAPLDRTREAQTILDRNAASSHLDLQL